jgi:hypothetical protein
MEALKGRIESAGNGHASLGQLSIRVELQNLKNYLTKIKEDVDLGIRRVEEVMGSLEVNGLDTGLGVGQSLGHNKDAGCIGSKPKRNKRRRIKKGVLKTRSIYRSPNPVVLC